MKYTYLMIDLLSVIIPFAFSFHPKLRFDRTWKAFWPACLITAVFFGVWDIFYTKLGVWGFNPDYLTGLYIFNLPIEEVLFFICIPYACLFTYHCLNALISTDYLAKYAGKITLVLILLLVIVGLINISKLYTGPTFLALSLLLYYLQFVHKSPWLGRFYFMYLVILIPFFIVNGILTGSGIESPIVYYDDLQNLSIRMMTIPVEDTFYGMLLILMNVTFYEFFKIKGSFGNI